MKNPRIKKARQILQLQQKKFNLNQLTGSYEIQAGVVLDISLKSDSLHVLQSWNQSSYNIKNIFGNTYGIPNDATIQFVFSDLKDDFTQILTVVQNGNETICKRKEKIKFPDLKLDIYTGEYYSEELGVSYLLLKEDDKLKVKIANYDAQELSLYGMDEFITDIDLFRFNKSNGEIKGFELDAGRVANLKFKKK